jgi:predicted ester cyclase
MPDYAALTTRFLMEHNQAGYLQAFDQLLSPNCVVHEYLPGLPGDMNRPIYEQFIAGFRAALPDIRNQVDDLIISGNRAVARWTGYGTHTGADLIGIPSSGKSVTAHGIYILRFEGDRIAEVWNHWDNLNVAQQLRGN